MDAREARFALGFVMMGLAPLFATAAGATVGIVIFAAGMLISTSTAFA
jgi:hypothetical protein